MCSNRICILMGTYILLTARVLKKNIKIRTGVVIWPLKVTLFTQHLSFA